MNLIGEMTYSFFHNEIMIAIMITAFLGSIASFSRFLTFRKGKNRKNQEENIIMLFTFSGLLMIMWSFYAMSFLDLEFITLNVTATGSFVLLIIVGVISFVDQFRMKQKTLDHFINRE